MSIVTKKAIKGFPGYEIHLDGRIWSKKTNRWLKPTPDRDGYPHVKLYGPEGKTTHRVHRLVALHWVTGRSKLPRRDRVVDHIDGDRANYHWTNLRWIRQGDNVRGGWARRTRSRAAQEREMARWIEHFRAREADERRTPGWASRLRRKGLSKYRTQIP